MVTANEHAYLRCDDSVSNLANSNFAAVNISKEAKLKHVLYLRMLATQSGSERFRFLT